MSPPEILSNISATISHRGLDAAADIVEGIEPLRLATDRLTQVETLAVTIAMLVSNDTPPALRRCVWCWRSGGFTPETWRSLPELDLEEYQAHLASCPSSPSVGARAIAMMKDLLDMLKMPTPDWSVESTFQWMRATLEARLENLCPTDLPGVVLIGPAPAIARDALVIHHGVKVRSTDVGLRPLVAETGECNHGVTFDEQAAASKNMTAGEVRFRWPRLDGECPLGCGYRGTHYASRAHYVWGDW